MSSPSKIPVAIIGANGYTGAELVRLLLNHPSAKLIAITSRQFAGQKLSDVYPQFFGQTSLYFEELKFAALAKKIRCVFLCLPHHESMDIARKFRSYGIKVIDLSADFRFKDIATYEKTYGPHSQKSLAKESVYGLCEFFREDIRKSSLVGVPGCYVTSILLGLAPLVQNQMIALDNIICDSASGVSGAGRKSENYLTLAEQSDNFFAYGIGQHRHRPEIEEKLGQLCAEKIKVTFTPHLLPITRGILSTIYTDPHRSWPLEKLVSVYKRFYNKSPFVKILDAGKSPQIRHVSGTNFCHIGIHVDTHSEKLIVVSALDNLIKGASGQAVQCFNLMYKFPEKTGLETLARIP